MDIWDRLLWELGFSICHQRADRLLFFGGRPLFVCARDTGIFVSFFGVVLVLSLLRREKKAGMPPVAVSLLCASGVLFLAWDALTSYLGWRESTDLLRLLSGSAGGAGLAVPSAALLNREAWRGDASRRLMGGTSDIILVSGVLLPALFLYLLRPAPLFRTAQSWLLVSILGTFWSLNLLLLSLFRPRRNGGPSRARLASAFLLLALELAASYWLHRLLEGAPVPPLGLLVRHPGA